MRKYLWPTLTAIFVIGSAVCWPTEEVYIWPFAFLLLSGLAVCCMSLSTYLQQYLLSFTLFYWCAQPFVLGTFFRPFSSEAHVALMSYQAFTYESILYLLIPGAAVFLLMPYSRYIKYSVWALIGLDVLMMLDQPGPTDLNGILGNSSMSCAFLAVAIWTLPDLYMYTAVLVCLILFFFLHAATAMLALVLSGSVYLAVRLRSYYKLVATAPLFLLIYGLPYMKAGLLQNRDRYDLWKIDFQYWWHNTNHFFGYGAGSYKYLGPSIQVASKYFGNDDKHVFVFMHSSWLQLLFTGGYIGFGLASLLFIHTALTAFRNGKFKILACILSYGICMLTQYPLDSAIFVLIGFWLLFLTHTKVTTKLWI